MDDDGPDDSRLPLPPLQEASPSRRLFQEEIRYPAGILLGVSATLVATALTLASVVKIDRIVVARGVIVPTHGSIYVESIGNRLIQAVNVSPGEVVRKGALLATVDVTDADAELNRAKEQYDRSFAMVERLEAERSRRPVPPDRANAYSSVEVELLQHQRSEYDAQLRALDDQAREAKASQQQVQESLEALQKHLSATRTIEQMQQTLVDKGFGSKIALLKATDDKIQTEHAVQQRQSELLKSAATIARLNKERTTFVEHHEVSTLTDLAAAKAELASASATLEKAKDARRLIDIRSPVDAVVSHIGRLSSGSTTGAPSASPEPLFTLTPLDRRVEVELVLNNRDIGFVRPGDAVVVKIDAFDFAVHGVVRGRIKAISQGALPPSDRDNVSPVFKLRAEITELDLKNVPSDARLVPGMTVAGDVHVGRRTILSYFLGGLLRVSSEAMREP